MDLLQITDSLNKVTQHIAGDSNNDGHLSFFELLKMGGWKFLILLLTGQPESIRGSKEAFSHNILPVKNQGI